MRKFAIGLAVLALGTVSASAADLAARPYTKAPAAADLAYNWSGWYVGANVGYSWGHSGTDTFLDPTSAWAAESIAFRNELVALSNRSHDPQGVVGGLQAGYNFQSGAWVFGVEADINAADLKKTIQFSGLVASSHATLPRARRAIGLRRSGLASATPRTRHFST